MSNWLSLCVSQSELFVSYSKPVLFYPPVCDSAMRSSANKLSSLGDFNSYNLESLSTSLYSHNKYWYFNSTLSVTYEYSKGFPGGSVVKNPPANAGDMGSVPGLGRSPGGGNSKPLQYSWLEILWTEEPDNLQSIGSQS